MPEIPTYRVTGDDWDPPEKDRREPTPALPPAAPEPAAQGPEAGPSTGDQVAPAEPATPSSGWAAPAPEHARKNVASKPAMKREAPGTGPASPPSGGRRLDRLPAPIGPLLARVPPRLLLGGAGLGVAAIAIIVLVSAPPNDVAATATTEPTELAPAATESCPTPTAPLPLPSLVVTTSGVEPRRLGGVAAVGTELDLEGPWPASLGPVEATIQLGSTMQLTATGACIAEWRAVAARPPLAAGEPWRPPAPETLQLGWQHADRIAWQPSVPLPPRGEWIVRLTVWYRDAAGATSPSPAASAEGASEGTWYVERYFRVVVEARDSS